MAHRSRMSRDTNHDRDRSRSDIRDNRDRTAFPPRNTGSNNNQIAPSN